MSLSHIRLLRVDKGSDVIEYKVQSPDFESSGKWTDIGRLRLAVSAGDYEFEPLLSTRGKEMLPPQIYKLPDSERQRLIESEFKDLGWGSWAMTIHHYAQTLLKRGEFPEHYP